MAGLWYFSAEAVKEVNQGQFEESSAQICDVLQNVLIDSQKISSSALMWERGTVKMKQRRSSLAMVVGLVCHAPVCPAAHFLVSACDCGWKFADCDWKWTDFQPQSQRVPGETTVLSLMWSIFFYANKIRHITLSRAVARHSDLFCCPTQSRFFCDFIPYL